MQTVEKHVDPVTRDDLLELVTPGEGPRVSLYMPTERVWNESKQNPARLKNLMRKAADRLGERGLRQADIDALLAPARELLDRSAFWQHQSDGLALFLGNDFARTYRMPLDFEERIMVSGGFHVRPLLKYLDGDGRFYVLTLSQGGVNLYCCTRHAAEATPLEGVPTSLPEAMQYDDLEAHLDFHGGTPPARGDAGGGPGIFHGHGDAADKANVKEQVTRFFRALDNGVRQVLNSEPSHPPLVLAGLDYLQGLYREVNQYPHVVEEGVNGNPSGWGLEDLHRRAWAVMAPRFNAAYEQALNDYRQLAVSEAQRVVAEVEEVVPAAYYKRVDTLFVPGNHHVWGTFDPEQGSVRFQDGTAAADLLDVAVAHTLLNSGTVHVVDPEDVPEHATVAAILRY